MAYTIEMNSFFYSVSRLLMGTVNAIKESAFSEKKCNATTVRVKSEMFVPYLTSCGLNYSRHVGQRRDLSSRVSKCDLLYYEMHYLCMHYNLS